MEKAVAEEYFSSLADLTVNSKPLINMLTMLADDYIEHSPTIVRTVEAHLQKVPGDIKLPVLYLIDSIVKNVGKTYISLFTQNIVSTFCAVFEQVDEKTRSQMFKLRQTWNEVFPNKKLYALDARVNSIDPAWPITAAPPRIHVNPKFLNTVPPPAEQQPTPTSSLTTITDTAMREELLKKQKELLELQKRKVELELLQTKAILEEQQKKLENQTATRISENPAVTSPTKVPKQKSPHTDDAVESDNKTKTAEVVPEVKSSGTKRRDPRLHSRKESDPRLRSRKENQQIQQESADKLPATVKDTHKGDTKLSTSDEKKTNESSSNNNSSRHQRKKSDKYKKHKDYKPRMKVLFGDSPETRGSESHKSNLKKPKETYIPSKGILGSRSKKNESITQDTSSFTHQEPPNIYPSNDNSEENSIKSSTKEEKIDDKSPVPEPIVENESQSQQKLSEPMILPPIIDLIEITNDDEDEPMEVEERLVDQVEIKLPAQENIPAIFKIDEPPILKSIKDNDQTIFSNENKTNDLTLTACGDTDLRLLPPQSNSDSEQPPEKKPKPDMTLFGEEDVDLRQSLVPLPPPPPIISKSDLKHSEGWANFKRSNSDRGNSGKSPKKRKSVASSPRSSCFRQKDEEISQDNIDHETEDRQNSLVLIMKEAEEQLKNETITYAQYNQMLKGVMSMNEENKLQEALMKDDYERVDSPESDSNFSVDVQKHFEAHSPDTQDSYRLQTNDGDEKSLPVGNLLDQPHDMRDNNDHDIGRRRSKYKNNDPYNRVKSSRHSRYHNQPNEPPFFPDNNKPWMSRQQQPMNFHHRTRNDMGLRWQYPNNRQKPLDYAVVAPPNMRMRGPRHNQEISLPPADPNVLDLINSDPMTYVTVGTTPKEVRFYGENAVVMMEWDDPRDLFFQPGSRRVFIDGVDVLTLQFNTSYREYTLNSGLRIRIRLGAPTRELFIDGRFYDVKFGGPPIEVNLGGRKHLIQLEGPLPFLSIGIKRTDLVVGKVNLIVDGKIENLFPIYLDSKPQRFEINRVPFIIRFVEALQTVVINGQPLKIPFGGIPVPIFFRGERHYIRLTSLPPNVTPGFVNIANMEGGRLPTPPPPRIAPPPPMISDVQPLAPPTFMKQAKNYEFQSNEPLPFPNPADFPPTRYSVSAPSGPEKPVDLLTSLMPPPVPRFALQNYQVEPHKEAPRASAPPEASFTAGSSASTLLPPSIDVIELYQKLVAMGVVPKEQKDKEKEEPEDKLTIKPVDFSKPETLKLKQPGLISSLYTGIQCSSCGVRFSPEQTVKYSQHLDWHFRQNRRERHSSRIAQSRKWNYDVSDWIQYQEIEDDEDRTASWFEIQDKKTTEEEEESTESTVPAKGFGENPCCTVCRDRFDQFFNEDKEEWQLRRAVCVEEKLYHPLCLKDEQESQGKPIVPVMMPVPEEEPETIETIDLDAAGDSGEEEKNNIDTIEIESTSKSPQELDDKPEDSVIDLDTPEVTTSEIENAIESTEVGEIPAEEKMDEDVPPVEEEKPSEEEKPMEEEQPAEEEKIDEKREEVAEDSDDDILAIEVIEPHIESYDILDDDDEEDELKAQNNEIKEGDTNEEKKGSLDEIISDSEEICTDVVIKTEPNDLINTNTNTSHINETIHLDGNSEFSAAPKILLPKKIKINISSILNKHNDDESNNLNVQDENSNENPVAYDYTQPLPPGEEHIFTGHVKPHLIGKKMIEIPPVNKGKEMSGLCTIM